MDPAFVAIVIVILPCINLHPHVDEIANFELCAPLLFFCLCPVSVEVLLLQLVIRLVKLGARVEDPGAGPEQILIVAVVLELMVYKVHEEDEEIDHLFHVCGLFIPFILRIFHEKLVLRML